MSSRCTIDFVIDGPEKGGAETLGTACPVDGTDRAEVGQSRTRILSSWANTMLCQLSINCLCVASKDKLALDFAFGPTDTVACAYGAGMAISDWTKRGSMARPAVERVDHNHAGQTFAHLRHASMQFKRVAIAPSWQARTQLHKL